MICKNGHIVSGGWCPVCENKPEKKKPKGIRPVSLKKAKLDKEYSVLGPLYLKLYPICEVVNCEKPSEQIHHKRGRDGGDQIDVEHFLAVCAVCHRYIEDHPTWAKEHGYSETRL